MTLKPSLIGISISGHRFLAWAYDSEGEILDTCRSAGMAPATSGNNLESIRATLDSWRRDFVDACPVLVSGAFAEKHGVPVTSRVKLPFYLENIGRHLHREDGFSFVPEFVQVSPPDLTGGTEASLFGIEQSSGLVCMPGDLTRHFSLVTGRVTSVSTELTGEIMSAIMAADHAASAGLPDQVFEDQVFCGWVERSLDTEDAVSPFATRAAYLTGALAPEHFECALSGLLIGADIAAHYDPGDDVILIADEDNLKRYGLALDALGADVLEYAAEDCLTDGLWEIAELAGLVAD